jgi:adenylate kinase family enzyme
MTRQHRPATGLSVTVCRDPEEFAALEKEWDELYRHCPAATPFQTHAWQHSWWLSYGRPGRLRLVLVRRDARLVGVAPLMLTHRPLPALVPLGGDITDYFDVLMEQDQGQAQTAGVARAMVAGLRRAARGAVVDLREVRPGAVTEALAAAWDGPSRTMPDSLCLELPGLPMDDLLTRMPASGASRSRAKMRKLDALGIEQRTVHEGDVAEALATLLRLHEKQWRGRGVTTEHMRPRFAEHLTRAATRMVRTGDAQVTEYRLAGETVAANITLLSAAMSGGYLYGADPALRAKADITTMLLRHEAGQAARDGRTVLSMLRGCEPHKRHWRPEEVVNNRLLLARPELAPLLALYTARIAGRERLSQVVHRRAPALLELRGRLLQQLRRPVRTGRAR